MWTIILKYGFQIAAAMMAFVTVLQRKLLLVLIKTFPRDFRGLSGAALVMINLRLAQFKNMTIIKKFENIVKKHPDKVMIYFEDEKWTFRQINEFSNRIGNYFISIGLQKGDSVGLFMENRPEYVAIWLGLSKIGAIPALINFNLRNQPLIHSIQAAKCKSLIFGAELTSSLKEILNENELQNFKIYSYGIMTEELENSVCLEKGMQFCSIENSKPLIPVNFYDSLYYVYTSGTTGLPKAAIIRHFRFLMVCFGTRIMHRIKDNDVIYSPLPLYHSAAGMLAIGQALGYGTPLVIRKKFSATNFWKDCIRYNVTIFQYIGEICRYLYTQPPSDLDKKHSVELMMGNGLRPELWEDFVKRFNINRVGEYYGSTEGNCNITNIDSHVGSVGFIPRILYPFLPMKLIKIDSITGEPIRKNGLCILCKPNEIGELVGKIEENHPIRDFKGYADEEASKKKIIKDVFKKGDKAFRSGDVLLMDEYGYFYFRDRAGDTFRWKGENVSTAEVESVISKVCGLKDAAAYGVEIPNTNGRAGMVAISIATDKDNSLDLENLATGIIKSLPSYARPLFLRIVRSIDLTGTYKMKKFDLQKDGFDIRKVKDEIYFFDGKQFNVLDDNLFNAIMTGKMRL